MFLIKLVFKNKTFNHINEKFLRSKKLIISFFFLSRFPVCIKIRLHKLPQVCN